MNKSNHTPFATKSAFNVVAQENEMKAYLLERYGPLLTRDDLVEVLGFPTSTAFDRYCQRGRLTLDLVRLPSRRGVFAHARDVARYLAEIPRKNVGNKSEEEASKKN